MEFNGTFFATIITFIVFVFIMNKILYAPILGIMEKRNNLIDSNYSDARENNAKSEEIMAERELKLDEAKVEARLKYTEELNKFKEERNSKIETAQKAANEELTRSEEELRNLSDEVKNGLKDSMTNLASDIAEKVLGYRSEVKDFDDDVVNNVLWGNK